MKKTVRFLTLVLVFLMGICPAVLAVTASTQMDENTYALRNNIDLAVSAIDGTTLFPDDTFSFNDLVGARTEEAGYEKALNGRGVKVVGGGVSQVASTLYLALKKQDDIVYLDKQVYGSKFTGGYVSSGNDAVVTDYKNDIDFSFLNEGDAFTINMWRSGTTVYCSLEEADWDDDDDWDDDEYIFPDSSWRKLTRSRVLSIPEGMWAYARNEIWARHGYEFNTEKYERYFSRKDWYEPGGFDSDDLNETEWYNMDLIKEMEDEYGAVPSSYPSSSGRSGGYIFPDSSRKKLTRSQILDLPKSQWGYARNEIYARHGYEFNTAKYRRYFNKKSWYEPGGFDTGDLNETEWYNMNLIKDMEDEYGVD